MSYVQKTLLPGENILYCTKQHYVIFFRVLVWPILAAVMFKLGYCNWLFVGMLLVMSILNFITTLISYFCSEYALTNKRIVMKLGFIHRTALEIFLDRIEAIYVEQTVCGRILNYGTVVIIGVGSTKNRFFYAPEPLKFHANVQAVLHGESANRG